LSVNFSQQYCHVVPAAAGGMVIAGRHRRSCLVNVADGTLTIIEAPAALVLEAPTGEVVISTPKLQRALGAATIFTLGEKWWSVDFGRTGRIERLKSSGFLGRLAITFLMSGARKDARRARELNQAFIAALRSHGASDRTPAKPE
jgi:hypothetical protein